MSFCPFVVLCYHFHMLLDARSRLFVPIYSIWQSSIMNDLLMTQNANAHLIPRATHFRWFPCLMYAFMYMFAHLHRVALRAVVMHEDIHTPVCFLVAASLDKPGLGTPGNKPFGLLSEGEPPCFFFSPPFF